MPPIRLCLVLFLLIRAATAQAATEVVNIRQKARPGEPVALPFDPARTTRVELLLRRVNPKQSETRATLVLEGGARLEGGVTQQVDRDDLHILSWTLAGTRPSSARLLVVASRGDVYIETATAEVTAPARPTHPHPDRPPHREPGRESTDLQRKLRSGEGVDTGLPARDALRVEARVRRLDPARRETRLDLNPGGGVAQVDRQDIHVVTWTPESPADAQGNLRIHARDGDVYIESVTVTYRRAR